MSDQFGSFLPIWDWHPALVGIFIFGIDFGAIMAIRIVIERKIYLMRWWSFRIGDTIGLPVYAGFAAVVVSDGHFSGFYTQWWWHVLALELGYAILLLMQWNNLRTGFFTREDVLNPSEMYHTAIFGVMFYLMASVFVPVIVDSDLDWRTIMAFVGLGVYILSFGVDQTPLVDKTPGRISPTETVKVLR